MSGRFCSRRACCVIVKNTRAILYFVDGSRYEVPDAVTIRREFNAGTPVIVCRDASQQPLDRIQADRVIGYRVRTDD